MEMQNSSRKRHQPDEVAQETLQKYLMAQKKLRIDTTSSSSCSSDMSDFCGYPTAHESYGPHLPIGPGHYALLPLDINDEEIGMKLNPFPSKYFQQTSNQPEQTTTRPPFLLQNMSEDDCELQKLFTLYDIKDDEKSKNVLEAKRRLRFTNLDALIVPEEKLLLITCCDHFFASYDELIDYVVAIGELRNKQIIVEHCYYRFFMNTLKMFYYTEKGWRFNLDLDEFFSGYMRQYRELIIGKMRDTYQKAKAARNASNQQKLSITTEENK